MSENHIDIPTYLLKEIFCSYITNPASVAKRKEEKESLAMSLVRLIRYAETHPIATPFYGTKLGSQMSSSCRQLFNKVHSTFEVEFETVKKEEELLTCRENISWEGWRCFLPYQTFVSNLNLDMYGFLSFPSLKVFDSVDRGGWMSGPKEKRGEPNH